MWAKTGNGGGGDPSHLDANPPHTNCWPEAPWGGGGGGIGGGMDGWRGSIPGAAS